MNIKKFLGFIILTVISLFVLTPSAFAYTKDYGNVTLSNWNSGNFDEVWDLKSCDLNLKYTINMSGIASPGWSVTEAGLREVGAPNLDPNNKGGFLLSKYASSASGNTANLNDYHALMKHGWLMEGYDYYSGSGPMTAILPGAYINYAFWFDRDGVDQWQAGYWNYKDGKTYNTHGVYQAELSYKNLDDVSGVMFAKINGEEQGFYTTGYSSSNPPSLMPVGKTFTGDMGKMQVFYGRGSGGGTVVLSDISASGCLISPTDKNQCKNDGWKNFDNPSFKNQGDCVSFVQSNPHAIGNKSK
jgi:hypothetical protein